MTTPAQSQAESADEKSPTPQLSGSNPCRLWLMGFGKKQMRNVLEKGANSFVERFPDSLKKFKPIRARNIAGGVPIDFETRDDAMKFLSCRISPFTFELPDKTCVPLFLKPDRTLEQRDVGFFMRSVARGI